MKSLLTTKFWIALSICLLFGCFIAALYEAKMVSVWVAAVLNLSFGTVITKLFYPHGIPDDPEDQP